MNAKVGQSVMRQLQRELVPFPNDTGALTGVIRRSR